MLTTIGIIVFGTLISSILYYFNLTSDKINTILLYLISISALFSGSLLLGKNLNQKGIITGALYFLFWFIIMFLVSLIIKENFNISRLIYYFILLIFSILGGIIGKNTKKETI